MMMRAVAHIVVFTISAAIAALISYFTSFLLWALWWELLIRMAPYQILKYVFSISYLCGTFLIISYEIYVIFYLLLKVFHNNRPKF